MTMVTKIDHQTQVGIRQPLSVPICTTKSSNYLDHPTQLQFNMQTPYSITSLASNFTKPQPLMIEKVPIVPQTTHITHQSSLPSSPASSISSDRLHFAVQLAKMDARKMKEKEGIVEYLKPAECDRKHMNGRMRKIQKKEMKRNKNVNDRHLNENKRERIRNREITNDQSDDKQSKEIKRLEKQIQSYLEKLDELIQRGQEVIHKKDKRLRSNPKDTTSHFSDDDTDPRQFERAEEQATRSARVLYMIERQIRELDDEMNRKSGSRNKSDRKSHNRGRLAAAQRATVRALQMLINSAPLQPKGSHHYRSMYQELTSLIQQLSLLSIQLENADLTTTVSKEQKNVDNEFSKAKNVRQQHQAFHLDSRRPCDRFPPHRLYLEDTVDKNVEDVHSRAPNDESLSINVTPERNATLKASVEALLRLKQQEKKTNKNAVQNVVNPKKKSVLWPSTLHTKRRRANVGMQKTVRFPAENAHFSQDTTASRLKKIVKEKPTTSITNEQAPPSMASKSVATSPRNLPAEDIQQREIERQMWLEEETRRKLSELMEMPNQLISEAEKAIKSKLRPILDQAEAVVQLSKAKPVHERFVDLASNKTMKDSEKLSEMILDDILADTVEEMHRLEDDGKHELTELDNNSTLENILEKLEQIELEEQNIRRRWTHVAYSDPNELTKPCQVEEKHVAYSDPNELTKPCQVEEKQQPEVIVINSIQSAESNVTQSTRITQLPLRFTSKSVKDSTTIKASVKQEQHDTVLKIHPQMRQDIFAYKKKFDDYLRRTNDPQKDNFNPWKVVERLSDEILDDVITSVAKELFVACDDVTEFIFQSEFMEGERSGLT